MRAMARLAPLLASGGAVVVAAALGGLTMTR
jgi:hypothetical protein